AAGSMHRRSAKGLARDRCCGGSMTVSTDDEIREILTETRTIALVGASNNPERASHNVMRYLLDRGFEVIPVNPMETEILGIPTVGALREIATPIDMVDVFRNSE